MESIYFDIILFLIVLDYCCLVDLLVYFRVISIFVVVFRALFRLSFRVFLV